MELAYDIIFSPQRTTVGRGWRCRVGGRAPARRYRYGPRLGCTFGSESGIAFHPENAEYERTKMNSSFPEKRQKCVVKSLKREEKNVKIVSK